MKISKKFILTIYLFSLLIFIIKIFFNTPILNVSKLSPNSDKNKLFISRLSSPDKKLGNKNFRKINTGDSYRVVIDKNISFQITSIAFASKDQFSLSNYFKYFPELIIEADDINFINGNNFGLKRSIIRNQYQTCLLFNQYPSFVYEIDSRDTIYKYNDYGYWGSIFKKEFLRLFKTNNFNCLLITTENPEIFENDSKIIYQTIKNNFIYEGY